jgi:hypothetical protein
MSDLTQLGFKGIGFGSAGVGFGVQDFYPAYPTANYLGAVAPEYVAAGVQNYDKFTLEGNWSGANDAGAHGGGGYFTFLQDYASGSVTFYCRGFSFGLWGFTDMASKGAFTMTVNGVAVLGMTQRQNNPDGTYRSWRYYTHPRQAVRTDFVVTLTFPSVAGVYPVFDGFEAIA